MSGAGVHPGGLTSQLSAYEVLRAGSHYFSYFPSNIGRSALQILWIYFVYIWLMVFLFFVYSISSNYSFKKLNLIFDGQACCG